MVPKICTKSLMRLHRAVFKSDMQGFTLLQVLVSLSLLALVVGLSSRILVVTQKAEYSLEASKAYENIQEALFDALQTAIRNGIVHNNVPCIKLTDHFPPGFWLQLSNKDVAKTRAQKPADVETEDWNQLFQVHFASGSNAALSLDRCSQQSLGTGGRFHFCLELQRNPGAPKNSIRNSPFAFVEVNFQLLDIQTGQNISCADYNDTNRNAVGASVSYLLYWVQSLGNQLEVKQQNGIFYVTKT